LARTFQRLELFGLLSAGDNVRLAADVAGAAHPGQVADELLERVGLAADRDVRADQLPTGRARRVELARALATNPKVLLLDEPASGQDDHETQGFAAIVRDVAAGGVAVVLVEHDVSLVMTVCDVIHVLDFGRVIATGSPAEVQDDPAVRRAYLGAAT
jgi:branched-chain amino acid transport system ATP-binding protein